MYETAASILYRNLGSEGWPRHYQTQDLYTFEWHFIYEFAKTSLYEWQKQLGMLNPLAEVYYPPTNVFAHEKKSNKNEIQTQEKDQEDIKSIDKDKEIIKETKNCTKKTNTPPNQEKVN